MSWHTSGLYINRDYSQVLPGLLCQLGFEAPQLRCHVDLDDATSFRRQPDAVATACVDGWTIMFNQPDMFGAGSLPDAAVSPKHTIWPDRFEQCLRTLSRRSRVFGFIAEGSTGTYGFTFHEDGSLLRAFLHHHSHISLNVGPPLPQEDGMSYKLIDLETTILSLANTQLPWDALELIEFEAYAYRSSI